MPDGLEYKLYMPNMGLHAQYGPSVYIHNIQAYACLINVYGSMDCLLQPDRLFASLLAEEKVSW